MNIKRNILITYYRLPEFIKDLLGFFFRRFKKFRWEPTSEEQKYFKHFMDSEFYKNEQLEQLQLKKLQKLLRHASTHVPYYRDLFKKLSFNPETFKSLEDLQKLPLLTKDMIRDNPEYFISELVEDKNKLRKITTGGSTGTPMAYYFDDHMDGVRRATWWRWSHFAGIDLYNDRMIYCGGAPTSWIFPPEDFRGIVDFSRSKLFLSSAAMSDKVLDRYIEDIKKFKGDYIRGYASGIYMLARRIVERGEVIPLKAVLTSSDALYPSYRDCIEKAFSCKVFDHYGQNEDILTATECGYTSGLHINMESCIAETVNDLGEPIYGQEGRFVSTHLENYTMPLIRYVVGDVGVIEPEPQKCPCGRSHRKIIRFTGRSDEIIVTPEGRRVGCGSMNQPMKTMPESIAQCQFIQERVDLLIARIVPTASWHAVKDKERFINNLRKQVGQTIKINLELVSTIATRANGKYQFIVSNLVKRVENEK